MESPRTKAKKHVGQVLTLLKYYVFCKTGCEEDFESIVNKELEEIRASSSFNKSFDKLSLG